MADNDHALQLAMFMQRRDAMQFGVVTDGVVTPSWEDSGLAQHEYIADAEAVLAAVKILGYVHAPEEPDAGPQEGCGDCLACFRNAGTSPMGFLVCGSCGNKRCPHLADHEFVCTGSNEPGQVGRKDPTTGDPDGRE